MTLHLVLKKHARNKYQVGVLREHTKGTTTTHDAIKKNTVRRKNEGHRRRSKKALAVKVHRYFRVQRLSLSLSLLRSREERASGLPHSSVDADRLSIPNDTGWANYFVVVVGCFC